MWNLATDGKDIIYFDFDSVLLRPEIEVEWICGIFLFNIEVQRTEQWNFKFPVCRAFNIITIDTQNISKKKLAVVYTLK